MLTGTILQPQKKRGSACYKVDKQVGDVHRSEWIIDNEIPIFSQDWEWFNDKII